MASLSMSLSATSLGSKAAAAARPVAAPAARAGAAPLANTRLVTEAKNPKLKTNKSAAKRFRATGTGKIMRRCAGKAHINEHKSAAQLKRLSTKKVVKDTEWDNISGMMPYLKLNRHSNAK